MIESTQPLDTADLTTAGEVTRIAEFELAPGKAGKFHYHSAVAERCFCLQGQLQINIANEFVHALSPGTGLEIAPGVWHQVCNTGNALCRYRVVQYGGSYDFVTQRQHRIRPPEAS